MTERLTPTTLGALIALYEHRVFTVDDLAAHLAQSDVVIDGGNTYYRDDIARARALAGRGIHYVDAGTSGGVWGWNAGTA